MLRRHFREQNKEAQGEWVRKQGHKKHSRNKSLPWFKNGMRSSDDTAYISVDVCMWWWNYTVCAWYRRFISASLEKWLKYEIQTGRRSKKKSATLLGVNHLQNKRFGRRSRCESRHTLSLKNELRLMLCVLIRLLCITVVVNKQISTMLRRSCRHSRTFFVNNAISRL